MDDDGYKAALDNWVRRMGKEERDALWDIVLTYQLDHMNSSDKEILCDKIKGEKK